jgi:outer membrane immunogenic protein
MKLKQHLLASALCILPFAANAADLPMKAPPMRMVQPVPFTWTGFYIGGSAGFISNNSTGTDIGNSIGEGLIFSPGDSYGMSGVGGLFGVNVGYNWQFDPHWVLGIEGDIAGATLNKNGNGFNGNFGSEVTSTLSALGTVRGRIGYAFDRVLIYATGGLAFGNVHNRASFEQHPTDTVDQSNWKTGWTVGGGLEYAFTNNWTVRVEGLYVDLGTTTLKATGTLPISGCSFGFKNAYALGRIGLNYKF